MHYQLMTLHAMGQCLLNRTCLPIQMKAQRQLQYVGKQTLAQGANHALLGSRVKKCSNLPYRAREPLTQHVQAYDEGDRNCRRFHVAGKPVDDELEGDRPKSNQYKSDEGQQQTAAEP